MAICASGWKLLQEATGVRRGRVYPVVKNVIIVRPKAFWRIVIYSMGPKNGLHTFGNNSAKLPNLKFGTLWAKCWGLAQATFGRDPRSSDSSDSSRRSRIFVVKRITHGFADFTFQHNNVDRCRHVNLRNRILKILP